MPRKTVKTDNANDAQAAAQNTQAEEKKQYKVKTRKLEPHTLIEVRNGFNGMLVYVSSRTGERFIWDSFGAVLDMELQDLRAAKNAHKGYFENNWFMIDDHEVLVNLGVERYYRNSLSLEEFDEIFKLPPQEIIEKIKSVPDGQKPSLTYRAKQLIEEGVIDSIKTINALEKSLGVELIER